MFFTISYPRSGATFVQFLLSNAKPKIDTIKMHGHDLDNKKIVRFESGRLLMIIRNYKECVMSHLIRDNDQRDLNKIHQAFIYYTNIIQTYENSTCKKYYIYYEDLIQNTKKTLITISDFYDIDLNSVISNISYYKKESKIKYEQQLGKRLTDGETLTKFSPLTQNYPFNWDEKMYNMNQNIYNNYLLRYKDIT